MHAQAGLPGWTPRACYHATMGAQRQYLGCQAAESCARPRVASRDLVRAPVAIRRPRHDEYEKAARTGVTGENNVAFITR